MIVIMVMRQQVSKTMKDLAQDETSVGDQPDLVQPGGVLPCSSDRICPQVKRLARSRSARRQASIMMHSPGHPSADLDDIVD